MESKEPVVRLVTLDEPLAREFLAKNRPHKAGEKGTNRKASKYTVNKWISDMLNGRWRLTHQGMAFGDDGFLDDGQQRLMAFLEACKRKPGLTIQTYVTWGLAPEAFPVMDTGRVRTVANVLSSEGVAKSKWVASTARLFHCYVNVPWTGDKAWNNVDDLTVSATLETIHKYPSIVEAVNRITSNRLPGNMTSLTTGLAICYEFRPDVDWDPFIGVFETGRGFEGDLHPAYILREKTIMSTTMGKTRNRVEQLAWFMKAANAYILDDKGFKSVRFGTGDKFPRLTALRRLTEDEGDVE